jgi:hypothetical protein
MNKLIKRIRTSFYDDEQIMKDALIYIIKELAEIKKLLTPKQQKVYKQPTNNSIDIIVGKEGDK